MDDIDHNEDSGSESGEIAHQENALNYDPVRVLIFDEADREWKPFKPMPKTKDDISDGQPPPETSKRVEKRTPLALDVAYAGDWSSTDESND